MWCAVCQKDLSECTCSDIDERLAKLADPKGNVVYRMCLVCGRHYARCKCQEPKWTASDSADAILYFAKKGRETQ